MPRTGARPQVSGREVAGAVGERLAPIGSWFAKDPLNTVLIVASLVLTFLFFNLLGQIQPSTGGERIPLSQVSKLAEEKQIREATLLDQDARVVLETKDGAAALRRLPGVRRADLRR